MSACGGPDQRRVSRHYGLGHIKSSDVSPCWHNTRKISTPAVSPEEKHLNALTGKSGLAFGRNVVSSL